MNIKPNERTLIAKEALPYLLLCLALIFVAGILDWIILTVVFFIAMCFVAFFFRNPPRKIKFNENFAYSPADGKIMNVEKISENRFLEGAECWKVTIFLSLFNVHFNRAPVSGTVKKIRYINGKFFPAFKSHASEENERNYILLDTPKGPIIVSQITGFVARRIVCYVYPEDELTQGDRFGLIKFGSCTEIYLPLDYEISVKPGDKVKGGKTVIGKI